MRRLWTWLQGHWRAFFNAARGVNLRARLAEPDSPERADAVVAVKHVIRETRIAPDCVSAGEIRGGCGIKVTHDDAHEWFVHHTYREAAEKAITWLKDQESEDARGRPDDYISTKQTSKLSRQQRRAFDAERKRTQRKNKKA